MDKLKENRLNASFLNSPFVRRSGRFGRLVETDWLLAGYLLLLFWLPLPLGSNRVASALFMEWVVIGLLLIWVWQFWRGKRELPRWLAEAKPVLLIWLAFLLLIGIQTVPLPLSWVELVSPQSAWLYKLAPFGDPPSQAALSVDRHASVLALHKSFAYFGLFLLTLLLIRRSRHYRLLAICLLASGAFQALYGSLMVLTGLEYGFFIEKIHYRNVATGTFINRNHFSNYLILSAAVGIGLLLSKSRANEGLSFTERLRLAVRWLMSGNIWLRFALIVIATGIVLSRSRMGNVAFVSSIALSVFLFLWIKSHLSRGAIVLIVSIFVVDLLLVGSLVGVDRVVERVQGSSLEAEHRDEVARDTLRYMTDFPLFGSGGGSFYTTYPRYKGESVDGYYDHTHNDYLEIAAEYGLPGLLLLIAIPVFTLWKLFPVFCRSDNGTVRGIGFTLMMATLAMMVHALVDFNLQIPANAATYTVLVALGWVACGRHWRRHRKRSETRRTGGLFSPSTTIIFSVCLVMLLGWSVVIGAADFFTEKSRYHAANWNRQQQIDLSVWQVLVEQQQKAVSLAPTSDEALLNLARLKQWLPAAGDVSDDQLEANRQQVLTTIQAAIGANPGFAPNWIALIRYLAQNRRFGTLFGSSLEIVDRLAPRESRVQLAIIETGLQNWYRLGEAQREVIVDAVRRRLKAGESQKVIALLEATSRVEVLCRLIEAEQLDKLCGRSQKG